MGRPIQLPCYGLKKGSWPQQGNSTPVSGTNKKIDCISVRSPNRDFQATGKVEQDITSLSAGGLWGALWVFYAFLYGRYFGHVAARIKPEAGLTGLPGSPERLRVKQALSYRFSAFMLMPTILETIRSSWFTGILITLLPCVFGVWVMHAVWREVLRSEVPQAQAAKKNP